MCGADMRGYECGTGLYGFKNDVVQDGTVLKFAGLEKNPIAPLPPLLASNE